MIQLHFMYLIKYFNRRNKKRLNVSITRAKKQLVLVCDTQTVSNEKLIFDFLNFLRKQNRKHLINKSVSIFPADPNNNFSLFKPPQSEEAAKIRRKIRKEMIDNNLPKLKLNRNDKIVGIDCEMVESEDSDVLARVSIVTRLVRIEAGRNISVSWSHLFQYNHLHFCQD